MEHLVKQVDDVMMHGISIYGEGRARSPHGGVHLGTFIDQLNDLADKFGRDSTIRLEEVGYESAEITIEYLRPEKKHEREAREVKAIKDKIIANKKKVKLEAKELAELNRLIKKYKHIPAKTGRTPCTKPNKSQVPK